jgi:hypothetical protein
VFTLVHLAEGKIITFLEHGMMAQYSEHPHRVRHFIAKKQQKGMFEIQKLTNAKEDTAQPCDLRLIRVCPH